ncbi:diguanylate cyclase [Zavarzinia sp. CC-PAN008]|uniref:diguanylate cyclase n=1 Tax=Zavarzinia sp. CC-PAN008 TaxID=3243332 RepID=UPI003F74721F
MTSGNGIPRVLLIVLACAALVANSTILYASLQSLIETTNRVKHSLAVKGELARMVVEMSNAESSQRGYLLTADIRYLEPYYSASNIIRSKVERLRELVSDNPDQIRHVDQIERITAAKFAEMAETVLLQSSGNGTAAGELVRQNKGKEIAAAFHDAIAMMERAEGTLLEEREAEAALARNAAFVTFGGFVATTVVLLAVLAFLGRREIVRKAQAATEHETLARELREQSERLRRERNEVAQLNEASNFLQSCDDMDEISSVLGPFLVRLFPDAAGAIHVTAPSRNRLDLVAAWGGGAYPAHFTAPACWGLRRGQVHARGADDVSPACDHLPPDHADCWSLCIPLVAQGETLGLLSLGHHQAPDGRQEWRELRRLAEMVARQIGLTLSNIRLRESLRNQSIRDPMTKAFNRRHLEAVFEKELAKARRFDRPLSVAMLDIDHFKRYNDAHGHQAGDAALIAVTQHIQANIRETDWLFRYGGEEFLLLFSETDSATAAERLDQLRQSVSELGIALEGIALPHVTVSCGVAGLKEQGQGFEDLVAAADQALYAAKKAGRNQVVRAPDAATPPARIAS